MAVEGIGTSVTVAADDHLRQLRDGDGARIGGGDGPAAAHHRDPVGVGDDLAELVGDEHDGGAARRDAPHGAEQPVGFLVGEHGGRLVEDQDARPADQHLQDLDPLLLGDRQHADRLVEIDLEAERLAVPPDLVGDLPEPAGIAAAGIGEEDILERGERPHQLEVLVDHADRVGLGVERAADRDRAGRRSGSGPRPARRGRRRRSSARTCRRRSRREAHGPRRS